MYLCLLEIQTKTYWSFEFLMSCTVEMILISYWNSFSILRIISLFGRVFGNFVLVSIEGMSNILGWDSLIKTFEYEDPIFTKRINSLAIMVHPLQFD
jgi:hypothetical protein